MLARVVELEPASLEDALRNLVAGEFVFEQELYPEAVYAFKHPLTQEVAYGSQLGERRAAVHAAVARAIAEQYPERLDERAALLAQHWEAAGETLEAARWHARAGAWAGTNDPTASLRHWRKVRELTDSLPDSEETAALGLSARIFVLSYGWRLGISHEEAEALFTEAERMASRARDLWSRAILLSTYGTIRSTERRGASRGRQARSPGDRPGRGIRRPGALHGRRRLRPTPSSCIGEYREGVAILDRAIELADGDPTIGAGIVDRLPARLLPRAVKGGFLCDLGRLEEGRELIERGMKLAGEQGDIETVGWGHMWSTWHAYLERRPRAGHGPRAAGAGDRGADRRLVLPHLVVVLARPRRAHARGMAAGDRGDRALAGDLEGAQDGGRLGGLASDRSRGGVPGPRRRGAGRGPAPRGRRACCAVAASRRRRSRTWSSPGSCSPQRASPHARRSRRRSRGRASWRATPACAASSP